MDTKFKTYMIPIGILIGAIIVFLASYQLGKASTKDELQGLKNQLAQVQGLVKLKEGMYENAAINVQNLDVANSDLAKRLEETGRAARMYTNLAFEYRNKFEYISTHPKIDTVYTSGDTTYIIDSTQRAFSRWLIPKYLFIGGRFQTTSPYNLYLDSLDFKFNLNILLSEDKDGNWFHNILCIPSSITPTQVSVQIKPKPERWKYFFAGGLGLKNLLSVGNVEASVGLGYKEWYGYIRAELNTSGTYTGIGIMKMFSF